MKKGIVIIINLIAIMSGRINGIIQASEQRIEREKILEAQCMWKAPKPIKKGALANKRMKIKKEWKTRARKQWKQAVALRIQTKTIANKIQEYATKTIAREYKEFEAMLFPCEEPRGYPSCYMRKYIYQKIKVRRAFEVPTEATFSIIRFLKRNLKLSKKNIKLLASNDTPIDVAAEGFKSIKTELEETEKILKIVAKQLEEHKAIQDNFHKYLTAHRIKLEASYPQIYKYQL